MKFSSYVSGALAAAVYSASGVLAQTGQTAQTFTEPNTGIVFSKQLTSEADGGLAVGLALPPTAATTPATEYIGYFAGPLSSGQGWGGVSHAGGMPNSLLLMFWPYDGKIIHSFRWAGGYVVPDIYTGNATLSTLWYNVNSTHYSIVYRCQDCWEWDQDGAANSQDTTKGYMLFGWAANYLNMDDPSNANSTYDVQHNAQDQLLFIPASAAQSSYSAWATKTATVTSTGTTAPTTTPATTSTAVTTTGSATGTTITVSTATTSVSGTPAPTTTYDYIIVGAGAGGIPLADKLSEAGKSVLLIERGPASSYRWGGRIGPDWLTSKTNATRFDVPALDNQIWNNSAGIACSDIDQMAGCVLGGGTAVNAGLWWKVPDIDWDYNFPSGWKSTDVSGAVSRVFSRIPGTDNPSMDGKYYIPYGYNLIEPAMVSAGWTSVTANNVPNSKNRTVTKPPFMYSHGERGGPMATYLVTANARKNFKMILNTDVKRVVRNAGHITGVEAAAYGNGGYTGTFSVTPTTGRVILSAGTFGSARILMRSGIGPTDQLNIVKGSAIDGKTMINSTEWITLPVGENLNDHVDTDIVISHPSIQFINYYDQYIVPNSTWASQWISSRSGVFAQSAPNIAPIMFESIYCSDGIVRQLEWTARCEGARGEPDANSMTISQYLGRGSTSRGKTSITGALSMVVSKQPYLQTAGDIEAVAKGIDHMKTILSKVSNLTFLQPAPDQNSSDYLSTYPTTSQFRRANHWIGSAKMGTDDGRNGGSAVVDTNTKVWGTDNLFVVDASIFPGMMSANPSAMIVTVAEKASEKILAMSTITAVSKSSQCYGEGWTTSSACATGTTCTYVSAKLWQCK